MWSDKEAKTDYLDFGNMVDLIVNISTNKSLSPSTIGLYGDWGCGKSTIMKLAQNSIEQKAKEQSRIWKKRKRNTTNQDEEEMPKTLCLEFNGWLFEGHEDTIDILCETILDALADEDRFGSTVVNRAKELREKIDFKKLFGRGLKFGLDYFATGSMVPLADLTMNSLMSSVKARPIRIQDKDIEDITVKEKEDEKTWKDIKNFKEEFDRLLKDSKVENLVVFIDDLDRCMPDTIFEVFEAIRLFLYVESMSFVIAADERLMQYAIKAKYNDVIEKDLDISRKYLEKMVQYPINIPRPTQAGTRKYLSCLLLEDTLKGEREYDAVMQVIQGTEPEQEVPIDLLLEKAGQKAEECKSDLAFAKQISSVLASSTDGNPRQCKRFLNTLYLRMGLAKSRGVELNKSVLAKVLLAKYYKPDFYDTLAQEANYESFRKFEKGDVLEKNNPFAVWKNDDWVKSWKSNGVVIGNEKLDRYVYFANIFK